MKWLLGIVLLVLIVVSARFRKFAAVFVLVGITVVLSVWQYQEYAKSSVKSRILPSELVLQNLSFKLSGSNPEYEMTGRVINNSEKYTLNGMLLSVTAQECSDSLNTECMVISEQQENIYITVPPGQGRNFRKNVYLYSNQDIQGHLVWNCSIQYALSE